MSLVHSPAVLLTIVSLMAAQQEPAPLREPTTLTEAWQFAQTMLRTHKVPVLVFVLPAADAAADPAAAKAAVAKLQPRFSGRMKGGQPPRLRATTARELFLLQLQILRGTPNQALHELLLSNLAVVAGAAPSGARPGETLLLLGADGKRERGFAVDLGDEEAVLAALAPHLLDADRLAARRANLDPGLRQDLLELDRLWQRHDRNNEDNERMMALRPKLALHLPVLAPLLLEQAVAPPGDRRKSMTTLEWLADQELPLGTAVDEVSDPCVACGMGYVPPRLASTLKLLAQ